MLGTLAFGIGDILSPFTERDGTTALNCFVLGIDFDDGVGTSRALLVDFPNLSIMGRGEVDLRDETLNLRFASNSKTASLATFAVPFVVRGTLASPQVRADSASAVVRGAGTWLNPLAAFGTLATLGAGRALGENPCVVAMREAAVAAGEAGGDEQPSQGRGGLGGGLRRLFGLQ